MGQEPIVRTLRNTVIAGTPAHAYLFCGSRGLGKTTLARVLARSLNCSNVKDGEACLVCESCLAFDENRFLDLVEIDAASNTGVDNIRALVETVGFQPVLGQYKIYIIDEAHMLSKGAWNALLKTLEEPPSHAVFILATTEVGKVPETINSRAQRFDFSIFPELQIIEHLKTVLEIEGVKLDEEVLGLIAKGASGSMRDALTLLDQVLSMGEGATPLEVARLLGLTSEQVLDQLFELITQGPLSSIPSFFESQEEKAIDFLALNRDFLEYLRLKLKSAIVTGDLPMVHTLVFATRLFLRSYKDIGFSPEPSLPLLLSSLEAGEKFQSKTSKASGPIVSTATQQSVSQEIKKKSDEPLPKSVGTVVEEVVKVIVEDVQADISIELEELEIKWHEVCGVIKGINSPLATLVRNSKLKEIKGKTIFLEVKYLFHKEQIESAKNRDLLQKALLQVYELPLTFRAVIEEKVEDTASFTSALKVFGGELVE